MAIENAIIKFLFYRMRTDRQKAERKIEAQKSRLKGKNNIQKSVARSQEGNRREGTKGRREGEYIKQELIHYPALT